MFLLGDSPFVYVSYYALKKELIKHYETGDLSNNYILEFRNHRLFEGEDPFLYMSKLRRTPDKANPNMTAEMRRHTHLLVAKPETAEDLVEKVKFFTQVDSSLGGGTCARVEESELLQVMA